MTAKLVDDITDTHSNKTRESWGQGIANIVTGFFGGMGGCAMIGQTMINVKASGARTRLSTFLAGAFLLDPGRRARRRRRRHPDGRPGRRDDHRVVSARSTGTRIAPPTLQADAARRDHRHGRHRRRHRRHPQPRHRRRRRRAHRHGRSSPAASPTSSRSPASLDPDGDHPRSTPCTASCSSPPATTSSASSTTPSDPDSVVIDLTARPRLGRLLRRRPRRHHHQVRRPRQDRARSSASTSPAPASTTPSPASSASATDDRRRQPRC